MVANYQYSTEFEYSNIRCAWLPAAEMWTKALPSYIFFTTFYQESTYLTVAISPPDVRCNSTSPGAILTPGSATCITRENFYTVNPEGMMNAIQFSFNVKPAVGTTLKGSTSGNNDIHTGETELSVTTLVKDSRGTLMAKYKPGSVVRMKVGDMLRYAGVDLDARAPKGSGGVGGSALMPFNRMTGVLLEVDMELVNYGQDASLGTSTDVFNTHNIACVLTITRQNDWTSLGVDVRDFKTPVRYREYPGSSKMVYRETEFVESYRQGVKVVYSTHGKVGVFNFNLFVNQLVQGLVLLTLSTEIAKFIARYCLFYDGTSQIFAGYQNTFCDKDRAVARTAALAGMQTTTFFSTLDPHRTGDMSKLRLFKNLRVMLSSGNVDRQGDLYKGLTPAQIASMVRDVSIAANGPSGAGFEDPVSMDEFCYLTGDDCCDLYNLIDLYKNDPGDEDMLARIMSAVDHTPEEDEHETKLNSYFEERSMPTTAELRETYGGLVDREEPRVAGVSHDDLEERDTEGSGVELVLPHIGDSSTCTSNSV